MGEEIYGDEFADYLQKTYNPLDVVFRLANETSLVLLNGGGFARTEMECPCFARQSERSRLRKNMDKVSSAYWMSMQKIGNTYYLKREVSTSSRFFSLYPPNL